MTSPSTDSVPTVDVDAAAPAGRTGRGGVLGRLTRRIVGDLGDPVLRTLVTATLVSRVGRGVFLTLSVLYLSFVVGLPAAQVALVLTVSSAFGVAGSFAGGRLADRVSARRLLLWSSAVEGAAVAAYALVGDLVGALVVAAVAGGSGQAAASARMAILARAFDGPERVQARATLRTVTNVSIAAGGAVGAIALALATPAAYRILLALAGLAYLVAIVRLAGLPRSADAPPPASASAGGAADRATARRTERAHSPWRDPRYLVLTVCCAVFGMQFGVSELGVPLWIAHDTAAPEVLVSAVLIVNTVIVVCFQVPLSRGTDDLRHAGRVAAIAAWLMAGACVVYATAAGMPAGFAVAVLLAAAIAHAFAEVLSQAAGWGLSFELADPVRAGTYQGVFAMGYSGGAMLAPQLVAATTGAHGVPGWWMLAALFLASGLAIRAIARRAARGLDGGPATS